MKVKFQATLQPNPHKWENKEIAFLLKYYPLYKAGSQKYTASWLRGQLKSRSMAALSKKYWEIMGSEHKPRYDTNQFKFDFAQDFIERK